jgi:hypothetical protein
VFKKLFPEYKDRNGYGTIVFLPVDQEADKYALKKGLFVTKATEKSIRIVNGKKFKPKNWMRKKNNFPE